MIMAGPIICNILRYTSPGSCGHLQEVLQQLGAGRAGAFGVELRAPEVPALDDGGEGRAMLAAREGEFVHGAGEAVDKVETGFSIEAAEQRIVFENLQRVPAHVWDGDARRFG